MAEGFPAPLNNGHQAPMHQRIQRLYPTPRQVDETLPDAAKRYLQQAIDTISAPDASLVMSAASVDAMLKLKGYSEGSLYARIDKAVAEHLLTDGMGKWAHTVRLEANAVRHADQSAPAQGLVDAQRALDFATALGDFLFVFTARVDAGVASVSA